MTIDSGNLLKDKAILVVDDEPDILDSVEEMLNTSIVHKAGDYETARQYLLREMKIANIPFIFESIIVYCNHDFALKI